MIYLLLYRPARTPRIDIWSLDGSKLFILQVPLFYFSYCSGGFWWLLMLEARMALQDKNEILVLDRLSNYFKHRAGVSCSPELVWQPCSNVHAFCFFLLHYYYFLLKYFCRNFVTKYFKNWLFVLCIFGVKDSSNISIFYAFLSRRINKKAEQDCHLSSGKLK